MSVIVPKTSPKKGKCLVVLSDMMGFWVEIRVQTRLIKELYLESPTNVC